MSVLEKISDRARVVGARCGAATVIAIDGPAGSGKTTLALALAGHMGAALIHMDDLYPGWGGLRAGGEILGRILGDLAAEGSATYQQYDWHAGAYGRSRGVAATGTIVVEGVGSVRTEHAHLLSLIVAVIEPDAAERLRRGLQRDGHKERPHWEQWMREETQLHAQVGLTGRADIVLDGHGQIVDDQ